MKRKRDKNLCRALLYSDKLHEVGKEDDFERCVVVLIPLVCAVRCIQIFSFVAFVTNSVESSLTARSTLVETLRHPTMDYKTSLQAEKRPYPVCKYFNTNQGCWKGKNCSYLHTPQPQHPTIAAVRGGAPAPTPTALPTIANGHALQGSPIYAVPFPTGQPPRPSHPAPNHPSALAVTNVAIVPTSTVSATPSNPFTTGSQAEAQNNSVGSAKSSATSVTSSIGSISSIASQQATAHTQKRVPYFWTEVRKRLTEKSRHPWQLQSHCLTQHFVAGWHYLQCPLRDCSGKNQRDTILRGQVAKHQFIGVLSTEVVCLIIEFACSPLPGFVFFSGRDEDPTLRLVETLCIPGDPYSIIPTLALHHGVPHSAVQWKMKHPTQTGTGPVQSSDTPQSKSSVVWTASFSPDKRLPIKPVSGAVVFNASFTIAEFDPLEGCSTTAPLACVSAHAAAATVRGVSSWSLSARQLANKILGCYHPECTAKSSEDNDCPNVNCAGLARCVAECERCPHRRTGDDNGEPPDVLMFPTCRCKLTAGDAQAVEGVKSADLCHDPKCTPRCNIFCNRCPEGRNTRCTGRAPSGERNKDHCRNSLCRGRLYCHPSCLLCPDRCETYSVYCRGFCGCDSSNCPVQLCRAVCTQCKHRKPNTDAVVAVSIHSTVCKGQHRTDGGHLSCGYALCRGKEKCHPWCIWCPDRK